MSRRTVTVDPVDLKAVDTILDETGRAPENLMGILQSMQRRFRYLPEEALRHVAGVTDITLRRIAGVATFYSQFRLRPAGKHTIHICVGTACHVKGANVIHDAFVRELGIEDDDDTDPERRYTIERVGCIGCCMLAPAIRIDNVTYGHLSTDRVPKVLEDFQNLLLQQGMKTGPVGMPGEGPEGELRICLCSSCEAAGSVALYEALLAAVADTGTLVRVKKVGCTGMSYFAPLVEVVIPGRGPQLYKGVKEEDAEALVLEHFSPPGAGRRLILGVRDAVDRLLTDEAWAPLERYTLEKRDPPLDIFLHRQQHVVTEGLWEADPLDLDEYRKNSGFDALARCISDGSPQDVIKVIGESGLRGRGGAGFPTARKMEFVRAAGGDKKYMVCNGDEGDPGAFMDRMLLESCPYRVIEGIMLAAYAVGADEGVLYVRTEYPVAVRRVREAIEHCLDNNLLGEDILGSGFDFKLRVMEGSGAFVCGEETALLASVEGRRGMPRLKPPFPASEGLEGKPTLINNVETCACIPWIIRNGAQKFSEIGTDRSRGTKVFALAGKTVRGGLIEVPMGATLREIVEDVGGGVPEGRVFKAVQIGGPSGGCVPARLSSTTIDYEALVEVGAIMGSGGIVVLDDTDCMVDIARYFLEFTQSESCGRCTPCRVGTRRMLDILEGLCSGSGKKDDIEKLEELGHTIRNTSLCGLGQTAPNPVLSTIAHFRDEYEAHIIGKCPAGRCPELIRYVVTEKCIGCTLCAQVCPVDAIESVPHLEHLIDDEKCVKCGSCKDVCPQDAVEVQ